MAAQSALERLLRQAKKRYFVNVALAEFGIAASGFAAGVILLLILGTQILNWYWPALLFAAGAAYAIWRIRGKIPSPYALAQLVDQRLHLADSLATAWYFSRNRADQPLVAYQLAEASRLAESSDVQHAVPFAFPRSLYVFCALSLVAGSLLALRYGLTNTLALRAPIAQFRLNPFAKPAPKTETASTKSVIQEKLEQQMQQLGIPAEDQLALSSNDPLAMNATQALATPDGKEPMASPEKGQGTNGKSSDQGENMDGSDPGENSSGGSGNQAGDQQGSQGDAKSAPGKPPQNAQNGKTGSNEGNNSLAEKMRDAVANLLSKLKPSKSEGQQSAAPQQGNAASQQMAQKGAQQGRGKSNAEGQGSPDPQSSQDGDGAQKAANKAGDKNADQAGNQDSKSGVGKSDGSKDVRDAEQLAAMGKISELLGKRSQQMAGEMSVEVASGNQQLKTAYTQKRGQHLDLGAEVDRDEVPLMYQPYVQKYFEEVHKSPAGTKGPAQVKNPKAKAQPAVQPEPVGH